MTGRLIDYKWVLKVSVHIKCKRVRNCKTPLNSVLKPTPTCPPQTSIVAPIPNDL